MELAELHDGVVMLFLLACGSGAVGLAVLVFVTWLVRETIGAWGDDWG